MTKLTHWLLSPLFYLGFALILIYFEIEFRIGRLVGKPSFHSSLDRLHSSLMGLLKVSGVTVELKGNIEHDSNHNYLFLSNHQSMFDLCLLYHYFAPHRPIFVPKKELAKGIPSISFVINNDGSAIIDRKNPKQAIRELSTLALRSKENNLSVVLFPEGTRSKDGSLAPYQHSGVGAFLKKAGEDLEIIPVYLDGASKLLNGPFEPIGFGTKITITIGDRINNTKDYKKLISDVEDWTKEQALQKR